MQRGFFITGTDTGVGKTFVGCAIAGALNEGGADVGVMKPVETGSAVVGGRLVPGDALALKKAAGAQDPLDLINPYRFAVPLAPNIAARIEGRGIDMERIRSCYEELATAHGVVLVEGAGGLMSPVTDDLSVADMAADFGLPLIIVAASRLGCINQTLLTVEAARHRSIDIKGIILNHPGAPDATDKSLEYNFEEIRRLSGVPVLAELPYTEGGTAVEWLKLTNFKPSG